MQQYDLKNNCSLCTGAKKSVDRRNGLQVMYMSCDERVEDVVGLELQIRARDEKNVFSKQRPVSEMR